MSGDDSRETSRRALRSALRAQRAALDADRLGTAAAALERVLAETLSDARAVAGYSALGGEMPVDAVLDAVRRRGGRSYLPRLDGKRLLFAPFDATTPFLPNRFGIGEPDVPDADCAAPDALDVVLVPLVAFDAAGQRLGMGGGFYDRTFEFRAQASPPPRLIGIAHAFQRVASVHPMSWDVPLDAIATDEGLFVP